MTKFLDFDGVIVDSIDECYKVSLDVYFHSKDFVYDELVYKSLFYKYRGLVRPVNEYMALHSAIEGCIKDISLDFVEIFQKELKNQSIEDMLLYEHEFFKKRSEYQKNDIGYWLSMNPIMPFGNSLVGKDNNDVFIVTTKNKEATKTLLSFYDIGVKKIYANEEIKQHGDKGALISYVMDKYKIKEALFIDDAVEHLDTVRDKRVKCFFANWGYGKNTKYPLYKIKD